MAKIFNINGTCRPDRNYMVNLEPKLKAIKRMIDAGEYFTINRARQYGKTTTLHALVDYLKDEYEVISLDFQRMSSLSFEQESSFVTAFADELLFCVKDMPDDIRMKLQTFADSTAKIHTLQALFRVIYLWCGESEKKIVLMIDEVDSATNNQVFLDFLAQLRAAYLDRDRIPTFHSVILAGVYDIRNMKQKIRSDEKHKMNSPWNIAAKFRVNMEFSANEIAGMLEEYEKDYCTGMNIKDISEMIFAYTSGYPYLVSDLCKIIDEEINGSEEFPDIHLAWTKDGVQEAVKNLLSEKNPLFESLTEKLNDYPEMKGMIYLMLFQGQTIAYNPDDPITDNLLMFGFIKTEHGTVQIANRIFETRIYNYFLTLPEVQNGDMYKIAVRNKNQFIRNGELDMELLLEKFVTHFDDIYGDCDEKFLEEEGRRYFMLYLKPIINGTGNYYVESRTRNQERTDLIIDYRGQQYIIEMKVWRGNAYNERGEEQLSDYLDHYHLKKGYMISFNFNKNKTIGLKEIKLGDKILIEAVV